MQINMDKTFIQSHKCEAANEKNIAIEQYKHVDGRLTWHFILDSFQNSFETNKCPYCGLLLPTELYTYSQIEEVSLLIPCTQIQTEFDLDKTEVIQDILDNQNVIAFAEKSGENIQVRWDARVEKEELTSIYTAIKEEYHDIKVGVYFKKPVKKNVGFFIANVNFLDMDLEEFLLSVKPEKCTEKIS
ncbi:MAG: hypothetical protein H2184_15625 [Candidatus Galacturonibacter soehngenii]|nr:hypothetical protein [Candidatus Galacturonibacter soehngenii]